MDTEFMYMFLISVIALFALVSPFLSKIYDDMKEAAREKREAAARRDKEQDTNTILNNILKIDATFDYVGSRGNVESDQRAQNIDKLLEILKPNKTE